MAAMARHSQLVCLLAMLAQTASHPVDSAEDSCATPDGGQTHAQAMLQVKTSALHRGLDRDASTDPQGAFADFPARGAGASARPLLRAYQLTEEQVCADLHNDCGWWAGKGYCSGTYHQWMKDNCCESCSGAESGSCDAAWGNPACDSNNECHSCGARIEWFMNQGQSSECARQEVASEFPSECGDCTDTCSPSSGPTIRVVSYNLYWWNAFQANPSKSAGIVYNIEHTLQPDTIGLQECNSAGTIQTQTGYYPASQWNDNNGVSVKPGVFEVLSSGGRNLNARGKWGDRYVNWAKLRHVISGKTFWHFNTHWCVANGNGHTCDANTRYVGAFNMMKAIQDHAGYDLSEPVVITGDFNAGQGEKGIQLFLNWGFKLAQWNYVDAVMYSTPHWTKISSFTGSPAGSDHNPVIADLELK